MKTVTGSCENNAQNLIKLKGIRAHGYGQISKMAVLDTELTITAKGILAYFCSYCGGGNTAFPGRERILHDLGINKDTYDRHMRQLVSSGYISKIRRAGTAGSRGFKANVYVIESFPPKYADGCPETAGAAQRAAREKCRAAGSIYAAGYGIVPKALMIDTSVSVNAKGLYAYLCAFSGRDYAAAPPKEIICAHLKISPASFSKYCRELCEHNYITKIQLTEKGRFAGCRYVLNQNPGGMEEETDIPEKPADVFPDTQNPDTEIVPINDFSDTQKPASVIADSNITVSPNITEINITDAVNLSFSLNKDEGLTDYSKEKYKILGEIETAGTIPPEYLADPFKLRAAVKILTDWDEIVNDGDFDYDIAIYKLFVSALTEMLTAGAVTKIRGAVLSYATIHQALVDNSLTFTASGDASLRKLADECCEYYEDMSASSAFIGHPMAYMKAIIYTKITEAGSRYKYFGSCKRIE